MLQVLMLFAAVGDLGISASGGSNGTKSRNAKHKTQGLHSLPRLVGVSPPRWIGVNSDAKPMCQLHI